MAVPKSKKNDDGHRARRSSAGSIRPLPGGRWEVRVGAGKDPESGKYRQPSRTIKGTRKEAEALKRKLLDEVDAGRHRYAHATVGHLLDKWLELAERKLSPTTARTYRNYIRNRIQPALGELRLQKLTTKRLDDFYAALEDEGLEPSTIRQVHAILRRALRQGEIWGWIGNNPARLATLPRSKAIEISPPVTGTVERLIAEALAGKDVVLAMAIFLASALGARRGEVCALRWSDVDFTGGTVTIARAIINIGGDLAENETVVRTVTMITGGLGEKDTKTHQRRTPLLESGHLEILAGYRDFVVAEAARCGVEYFDDGYILSRCPAGCHPIDPNEITSLFRAPCRRLRLKLRFHDLRHFHATELLDKGIPLPTVSKRLGHRHTSTTANIYGHGTEAGDRLAADVAGRIVPAAALDELRRRKELNPGPDANQPPASAGG
jgi:integrase